MNDDLLNNLAEIETGDELYICKPKGADGLDEVLGTDRVRVETDENILGPYVFASRLDAIRFLQFIGLDDPDQWEVVSSKEFGGAVAFLEKASSNFTHVVVDPFFRMDAPVVSVTIEDAIRIFKSRQAKRSNSGGRQRPFWLLTRRVDNGRGTFLVATDPGVEGICLFKTEMDTEEARHSWQGADILEPYGPPDPDYAIALLEEISSEGYSHALINPPPSDRRSAQPVPIGDVIDHLKCRGHIRDLA
jgi:hypothetical protein